MQSERAFPGFYKAVLAHAQLVSAVGRDGENKAFVEVLHMLLLQAKVCACVCTCLCLCTCACACACTWACVCLSAVGRDGENKAFVEVLHMLLLHAKVCACVCVCACAFVVGREGEGRALRTYACAYIHTHIYIHIYRYIYMCVCVPCEHCASLSLCVDTP